MLSYPIIAKTVKTIDQFKYNMYRDISLNRLQYNNDSSAILRILQAIINTSTEILEDLKYKPRFNLSALDFTTIDRFNGFNLEYIPNVNVSRNGSTVYAGTIIGHSAYTNSEYEMEYVKDEAEFTRHSLPCDCFIGEQEFSDGYETIMLQPYVKVNTDIKVLNSKITITPFRNFNASTMEDLKSATVRIYGLSLTGQQIEEDIIIDTMVDYVSANHYSLVTGAMVLGSTVSVTIVLSPFIKGDIVEWDNTIVDRETFQEFASIVSVDKENKNLVFNVVKESLEFPKMLEAYRLVKLEIADDENVLVNYVDKNNSLVYAITDASKLYCFPLIIPISYNNKLDELKTEYQSMRIEYINDTLRKEYTFYIFPSSRTNDIESMSIFINGEEYLGQDGAYSNVILDLLRTNIETNRITIPYEDIFENDNESLVEFRSYGANQCVFPMWLTNLPLKPVYIKDLSAIPSFVTVKPEGSISASITSNNIGYKQHVSGNMGITDQCSLIKLSSVGNILVNGYRIENVFKTFTYDEQNSMIITSDTITHLKGN